MRKQFSMPGVGAGHSDRSGAGMTRLAREVAARARGISDVPSPGVSLDDSWDDRMAEPWDSPTAA